ncbi:MAG: response regulator [Elusimicrobiota bacterium]
MDPKILSQIAHQIRTPMTVILSTVNNFLDGAYGRISPLQKTWVEKLNSQTLTLEKLLNDLIDQLKQSKETMIPDNHQKKSPIVLEPTPLKTISSTPTLESKKPMVLVVDDENDILDVVQEGLSMQGFETIACTSAQEGIKKALEEKPDLIIMDVLLKDQNGLEVAREIKARTQTFIPIIMVTGQDDLRSKMSQSQYDADDLLTKPFQMVELFARVHSMLKLKKLSDEVEMLKQKTKAA